MSGEFEPRVLICCECGEEFVFTTRAQQYYAERGFTEDPKRCSTCDRAFKKRPQETEPDNKK